MKILQISLNLLPNIGGLETHLSDLFEALVKRKWNIFALTYQPLTTHTNWKLYERKTSLTIFRIPWLRGFFERFVPYPLAEFVYLVPALFIFSPFVILFYKPNVIHAHGLIAAVPAIFWGRLFHIRTVISLHNFYGFPKQGLYRNFAKFLLNNSDFVLCLSKQSNIEVKKLGIKVENTGVFTYWINLEKFKKILHAKEKLDWQKKFIVLFVGRLIKEKGIEALLESVKDWDRGINLEIIGTGPLVQKVINDSNKIRNINFLGKVSQDDLPIYYSAADLVIVPSVSEEGFGRVIIESLSCGTPVVASRKGAITEAMDETVGRFIEVTPASIKEEIALLYKESNLLSNLAKQARKFAERRYAENNVNKIIHAYGINNK